MARIMIIESKFILKFISISLFQLLFYFYFIIKQVFLKKINDNLGFVFLQILWISFPSGLVQY